MNADTAGARTSRTFSAARVVLLVAVALALAGCETTGRGPMAQAPAKPPEPPMTRSRAAMECWMTADKASASVNLDKRADIVAKCIDDKLMKARAAPPA